ncbi:hypothetical protein AA313_de0210292 [Arthrobotrys entomopaga]|nr:hypothetical protein AA313_de0210292 [Arthrobotrys entomopaga]
MPLSKPKLTMKALLLLVTIISTGHNAIAAPVADVSTAVSSAPEPRPNEEYNPQNFDTIIRSNETRNQLKQRDFKDLSIIVAIPTATPASENSTNTVTTKGTDDKTLDKRAFTRLRSNSAPGRLNTAPGAVVEETVQIIPSQTTDQDYSYVWPSAGPVQSAVGAWSSSPAIIPKAIIPNQGFQVLDGLGNPIKNDALQPESLVPSLVNGAEQNFDPTLFDEPVQVLDGLGNPIRNNALQPVSNVPGLENGAEQYFDPGLFEEPVQVLDGLGNPIKDNALQPEAVVPGWQNGAEQYFDPNLFNQPEPVHVLDGLGNPIVNDALQPEVVVPGIQNGPEQYFDPSLFNEPEPVQVLDGLGNPIVNNALQPEAVVPNWINGPEQHFDPGLFEPDQPAFQVLDGLGNPLVNDALQPEALVPGWQDGPEQHFDPSLFEPEPVQILDGLGNPIRDNALQPESAVPLSQSGLEQYFDPALFDEQPIQILDGLGNPIQNNALQPEALIPVQDSAAQYLAPGLVQPAQPFQILDGLGNPIRNNALQPEALIPAPIYRNGPERYFDPGLFDQPSQSIDTLDNLGNPIENDVPNALNSPADVKILENIGQSVPGQVISNIDNLALPAIVNDPDLWRGVLNNPRIRKFLQDNTPTSLGPLLDDDVRRELNQQPASTWRDIIPEVSDSSVNAVQPVLDILDNLTPAQQSDLITNGPGIADLANTNPAEVANVFQQVNDIQMPDPVVRLNTDGRVFTPNGFEQNLVGPNGGVIQDVVPINAATRPFGPDVLDVTPMNGVLPNDVPVTNMAPFLPQAFNPTPNSPNGFIIPDTGIADNVAPYLLPDLPGVNQNFDGTLSPFQPDNIAADLNNLLSGNPLLNGGAFTFNCVPVYVDANGMQRPFTDMLAQALRSLNVNIANYDGTTSAVDATDTAPNVIETVKETVKETVPGTTDGGDTLYSATNKDAVLDPFLREVVDNTENVVTAKKVDSNTVLVNTDNFSDAEQLVTKFDNGWDMTAKDTGGPNTFDTITLEKGDTKFDLSDPSGFDSASILAAKTPGEVLNGALRDDTTTVAIEDINPLIGVNDVTVVNS